MYAVNNSDVWAEGCRNTQLLIADRVDTAGMFEFVNLMPRFPIPAGFESEDALFAAEVWKGMAQRYPAGIADDPAQAGRVRDRHHRPDGLPGLLPGGRRLHQLGEEQRRRGRPRPRLGRRQHRRLRDGHHRPRPARARPDLRAVPQPRAHLDARHRHRLRRTRPRRRHPLRHPEVGQRQGRPDHHLRHDQGEGRDQGLDPGPRLPLRPRRPHHQGVPAGRDGQGHPAVGHLRRGLPPLRRGRRPAQPLRHRGRGQADHRHRQGHRGADPPARRARGRRDHVRRAAHRPHPDLDQAQRRRGHHAVRLPDLRGPRPAEDGLPRPAQPDDHGRRGQGHRGQPGPQDRPARPDAGRQARLRAAVPRRHAGRVPVRLLRLPDPAAPDEAGQLRGHLRPRRPVPARPDGRQQPHQLRAAQEQASRRSPRSTPSWKSRCGRSWSPPTA